MVDSTSEVAPEYEQAIKVAWRFISYRPRTEHELSQRLIQKGYKQDTVNQVIATLTSQGEVDDFAFARLWVMQRENSKPMGRIRLSRELEQKGVPAEIIATVLQGYDFEKEYQLALTAAEQRWPKLILAGDSDSQKAWQRLSGWLGRRGFSNIVIVAVLRELRRQSLTP